MNFNYICMNNKFIWENDEVRIVFSNPRFQGFDEFRYITDNSQIMHFYYTVSIYKKVYSFSLIQNKCEYKLVTRKNVYDFPQVLNLFNLLETLLYEEIPEDMWHKVSLGNKEVFKYRLDVENFYCDDYYSITKYELREDNKITHFYDCYIGCSVNYQGGATTEGIRMLHLEEKDIEMFYQCVKEFIQYAIMKHNVDIVKMNKKLLSSYKVEDNKLYRYNKKQVDEVIKIGDVGDLVELEGDIDLKDFTSRDYCNFMIKDITENSIVIEGILKGKHEVHMIPINKLLEVFIDIPKKKLQYNVAEIAQDWVEILSEKEKKEFKSKSIDELNKKWRDAIINRTWICRDEHNLEKLVKDTEGHANVYANVVEVIKKVKSLLNF